MDCEKFDRIVLDLLYDELDELTAAAAKRHMEHCARCRGIGSGLRATREVGVLPLLEAPEGLQERILVAERRAREQLPVRQRFGRGISVLAGYAMRPQLAMAALLLLMIGSSLLFLRARPGERESMQVTERGVPETESESVAIVPVPEKARARDEGQSAHGAAAEDREARREKATAAPAAEPEDTNAFAPAPPATPPVDTPQLEEQATLDLADAGTGDEQFDQALADYRAGRYAAAQRNFDGVASQGKSNAPSAELYAAQALKKEAGCNAATSRLDSVGSRHQGSGVGNEALWQAADCYRSLGQTENARKNYQQLVGVPGYDARAQRALASLDAEPQAVAARKAGASAGAKAPAPPKAAAKSRPGAPKKAAPAKSMKNDAY